MEINKPVVIGFITIVFTELLFIIFKNFEVIDWGWAWIFAPVWIPYVLFMIILAIYCIVANNKERKKHGE